MDQRSRYRIGVDIGGTFTDFTVMDETGKALLWKQDTTPDDPSRAIGQGLEAVAGQLGITQRELLERAALFVHGTTVATNGVIQRRGPRVGLLCTEGFRDVLYFRDGFKPERFNVQLQHPQEFVDRWVRIGVPGRILADGSERTPLDEGAVRAAAARFREAGVGAVAVAFLWSIVDARHELRAVEILREELGPDVPVLASHDVLPEIREWERTSATVLSAFILPLVRDYLRRLEGMLADAGLQQPLLIMQINGGCATVDEVVRRPVNILHSGPAAAPAAAAWIAESLGERDLITVDMGGTSLDVCMIEGGRAAMTRKLQVEDQPIGVPGVEVHSIGAGGGSIAWIDNGGALRVGPRSAGSVPGPACYDAGGDQPTVTDANVVLGYLDPEGFLAGRRALRADLSEAAVMRAVGEPLGLDARSAAAGVIRVVNANMVGQIRAVSIERGIDPRGFTLVCGGGAGGLHAAALARQIGMSRVLVPREAGTLCAFGMTVTDVRHDRVAALHGLSGSLDLARVQELFAGLEAQARERLVADGFSDDQIEIERTVDARYPGQVHELSVALGGELTAAAVEETVARFHAEHQRLFSYARPALEVEFLHWRVAAIGRMRMTQPEVVETPAAGGEATPASEREMWFEDTGVVRGRVYAAEALEPGALVRGPAVVQAATTTIVVPPGDVLIARTDGSLLIEVAVETAEARTPSSPEVTPA